jgi:hypothetical protein
MGQRWCEEELILLEKLVNTMPIDMITDKINEFHLKKATSIIRTVPAIAHQLKKIGCGRKATEDNLSIRRWSEVLGLKIGKVSKWTKLGLICIRKNNRSVIVSKKELICFAKRKPHLFTAISEEILLYYFGDELARYISQNEKHINRYRIKRLDNNKIYPSLYKASKELKMSCYSIRREATQNGWLQFV